MQKESAPPRIESLHDLLGSAGLLKARSWRPDCSPDGAGSVRVLRPRSGSYPETRRVRQPMDRFWAVVHDR